MANKPKYIILTIGILCLLPFMFFLLNYPHSGRKVPLSEPMNNYQIQPYDGPYTLIVRENEVEEWDTAYVTVHSLLPAADEPEKEWDDFRVLSVAEGNILKVIIHEAEDMYENKQSDTAERKNFD